MLLLPRRTPPTWGFQCTALPNYPQPAQRGHALLPDAHACIPTL